MRRICLSTLAVLAVAVAGFPADSARAQEPEKPPRQEGRNGRGGDRMRQAIEKAHRDPEVAAARARAREAFDDYKRLLQAVLEREDPEAARIAKSMQQEHGRRRPFLDAGPRPDRAPFPVSILSAEEKARWDTAWKSFREGNLWRRHQDRLEAAPEEERPKLGREFRREIETAMLEIDPELGPVFEKLKERRGRWRGGPRRDRNEPGRPRGRPGEGPPPRP